MSDASSYHGVDQDETKKRALPSSVGPGGTKNKPYGRKPIDNSKGEIKIAKGSSSACVAESSINNTDFSKIMEGVVFVLSGFVNPERATLRSQALEMGAEYRPDWNSDCTMLVCAFPNTPKFRQVKSDGGTIVSKEWISECYNQKRIAEIEPYLMHVGKPWRNSSIQIVAKKDQTSVQHKKPLLISESSDVKITGSKRQGEIANDFSDQFSPFKLKQWALDDLQKTISWLESQDEKPEKNEIKTIAAEGILTCLQDAIDSLGQDQDVRHVSEQWMFVPHVVKVLLEVEEKSSKTKLATKKVLYDLAIRCKKIYEQELSNLDNNRRKQQKTAHDEKGTVAVQIKPGDAEYDSDETIVMTEEEIGLAYKQLYESCKW